MVFKAVKRVVSRIYTSYKVVRFVVKLGAVLFVAGYIVKEALPRYQVTVPTDLSTPGVVKTENGVYANTPIPIYKDQDKCNSIDSMLKGGESRPVRLKLALWGISPIGLQENVCGVEYLDEGTLDKRVGDNKYVPLDAPVKYTAGLIQDFADYQKENGVVILPLFNGGSTYLTGFALYKPGSEADLKEHEDPVTKMIKVYIEKDTSEMKKAS